MDTALVIVLIIIKSFLVLWVFFGVYFLLEDHTSNHIKIKTKEVGKSFALAMYELVEMGVPLSWNLWGKRYFMPKKIKTHRFVVKSMKWTNTWYNANGRTPGVGTVVEYYDLQDYRLECKSIAGFTYDSADLVPYKPGGLSQIYD